MAQLHEEVEILRYSAFTDAGRGGNPAGVVVSAGGLDAAGMQAIATDVGYSETAFLRLRGADAAGRGHYDVRYFTPEVEVPFCGHATIAAAVALAERGSPERLRFHAPAGQVLVETREQPGGGHVATLTSVAPRVTVVADADVDAALEALGWDRQDLDPRLPPRLAFAGADHLILAAASRDRLARLDYDWEALSSVLRRLGVITLALIWREDARTLHARNPAPHLGIAEDPATGAGAAAVGAFLVAVAGVVPPTAFVIRQGEDMGAPSRLEVELDTLDGGIRVSGAASALVRSAAGAAPAASSG